MNKIKEFNSDEFGNIRTIMTGETIYFVGLDIAKALGYSNARKAVNMHCKHLIKRVMDVTSQNGTAHKNSRNTQEMTLVPEGDVYRLIVKSKLPSAEKFESWVFDEVLPQIRKTGGYIPVKEDETNEEFLARAFIIATETIKQKDEIISAKQKMIEEQNPLVEFADKVSNTTDLIDMGSMAKLLKDEHIDIGRNRLFEWLRKKKILMRNNIPYQQYIDSGHFKLKETVKTTAYGTQVFTITLVTGKGQIYITEKLRKEFVAGKTAS